MGRWLACWWLAGAVAGSTVGFPLAAACPFCTPVSQTLSEELDTMDAVVVGRVAQTAVTRDKPATKIRTALEVSEILNGRSWVKVGQTIEALCPAGAKVGDRFLIMGVDPPKMSWSGSWLLSDRGLEYVRRTRSLPQTPDRLTFFQDFLQDQEPTLARDAYDEFAKAPYADLAAVAARMNHDQIVAWIKNPQVEASRRRLYLVLLSVCGGPSDLPLLETLLRTDDRRLKIGLDAMVGCYLILKGPEGLPLIEDLYLKNPQAKYADTYAAIAALRFLGSETRVISRERILESLRYLLDRPPLADLVIADLARWEDWSQIERLVKLFKDSDDKSNWVRVPIVNYLRACPIPKAQEHLAELRKLDPNSVERATAFFPFGSGGR